MSKHRKLPLAIGISVLLMIAASATALADSSTHTTGSGSPVVYQAVDTDGTPIVLGPQSSPTYLGGIPAMQPGTYLVQYSVGVTMGPDDNVVCAAANTQGGNDGIFGTVGNGATNSGTGPDGIYGQASTVDTIKVTKGQTISLTCNVGHYGQGTYAGSWSLTATKIGTLHKTTF
jgi:hypothetical protein